MAFFESLNKMVVTFWPPSLLTTSTEWLSFIRFVSQAETSHDCHKVSQENFFKKNFLTLSLESKEKSGERRQKKWKRLVFVLAFWHFTKSSFCRFLQRCLHLKMILGYRVMTAQQIGPLKSGVRFFLWPPFHVFVPTLRFL